MSGQGLLDGKSSISTVTRFDATDYTCQIASQVRRGILSPLSPRFSFIFSSHLFAAQALLCAASASTQVSDSFKAEDYFTNKKTAKSQDRYTHFGVAAARLALEDAKLDGIPHSCAKLVLDGRLG